MSIRGDQFAMATLLTVHDRAYITANVDCSIVVSEHLSDKDFCVFYNS